MKILISDATHFPKVGDIIYIESACYLSHGADDIQGGKARIAKIDGDQFTIEEFPQRYFYWSKLAALQDYLKEQFKDSWAHRDPDNRAEFNKWD